MTRNMKSRVIVMDGSGKQKMEGGRLSLEPQERDGSSAYETCLKEKALFFLLT